MNSRQEEIEKLIAKRYMYNAETGEVTAIPIDNNYISKNKIRELIKNDKENIETLNNSYNFESAYVQAELEEKRRRKEILQELLEEN